MFEDQVEDVKRMLLNSICPLTVWSDRHSEIKQLDCWFDAVSLLLQCLLLKDQFS